VISPSSFSIHITLGAVPITVGEAKKLWIEVPEARLWISSVGYKVATRANILRPNQVSVEIAASVPASPAVDLGTSAKLFPVFGTMRNGPCESGASFAARSGSAISFARSFDQARVLPQEIVVDACFAQKCGGVDPIEQHDRCGHEVHG
jgi:hypothetical protein